MKDTHNCRQNLKSMITMREFERVIKDLANQGFVGGAVHCYTGEEAVALGGCLNLEENDYVFSTHRGHGHALAKGLDLKKVFAELMGKADRVSKDMDLTVVTYGIGVSVCQKAIKKIPEASIELIDLRSLVPMDMETVLNSVKKTGRLLVVHEATAAFSVGAEIVRRIVEQGFDYLDAEPLVYGNLRTVALFAGNLEDAIMLSPEGAEEKMRHLLTGII